MKIISKFKDYYDFLQGIYGIDEKLILDRTDFFRLPYSPTENSVIRFWICGYLIEGLYHGGKFLYGDELKNLSSNDGKFGTRKQKYYYRFDDMNLFWYMAFPPRYGWTKVAKGPILFENIPEPPNAFQINIKKKICPNDELNCPILCEEWSGKMEKFPVLSDFEFHKILPAEKIWLMLSEWLGREKIIPNNQNNTEKIISHGFDLKSSFRHPVNTPIEKI